MLSHPHPLTISLEGAGARQNASLGEPSGAFEPAFSMGRPLEECVAALVSCSARILLFRAWPKFLVAHTEWKGWQSGWKYHWKFSLCSVLNWEGYYFCVKKGARKYQTIGLPVAVEVHCEDTTHM